MIHTGGASRIRVTIDRLVLNGFESGNQKALVEGLQAELSRALADPAARAEWARSHRTPVLRLGSMPLEQGVAGARKLGQGVGRGIGRGLKP
jgi:hypothetical protein